VEHPFIQRERGFDQDDWSKPFLRVAGFGLAELGGQYCEESPLFPGYSDVDEVWGAC
jgi:hypothetical protein